MAKYFYEKWDYKIDINKIMFDGVERVYSSPYAWYKIDQKTLSLTRIRYLSEVQVGDLIVIMSSTTTAALNAFENGESYEMISHLKKVESNTYTRIDSLAPYDINSLKNMRGKTTLIDTIVAEEGTYPDNGIQGVFWYVKKGLVETFPAVHVKVGTAIKKATNGYVKTGGVLKEIKEIYTKSGGVLKKAQ